MRHLRGSLVVVAGVAVVLAGLLVGYSLHHQSQDADRTAELICAKVDRLDAALIAIVSASRHPLEPGQYGYDYQQTHPAEATMRGRNVDVAVAELRKAACDPNNLP